PQCPSSRGRVFYFFIPPLEEEVDSTATAVEDGVVLKFAMCFMLACTRCSGNSLPLRGLPLQEGECFIFYIPPLEEEVDSTATAVEDGGVLKFAEL
ncbi:MAG: hypothetical protein IJC08_05620, partial [Bacteroidaceae bacterium]|nr:hypothetical protein [Bacteroidaceae bacterium]